MKGELIMAFIITSTAFTASGLIPAKFTCDGADVSPALQWSAPPAGTQSLALIMDDPDAPVGNWDHWILFNLPTETKGLVEGVKALPTGTQDGKNSWGHTRYGGPCPPDREHRYFFKLYALDSRLTLKSGASKKEVEAAMENAPTVS